jgi:hypothetical protein
VRRKSACAGFTAPPTFTREPTAFTWAYPNSCLGRALPARSIDFILTDPPYIASYRSRDKQTVRNDDNAAWSTDHLAVEDVVFRGIVVIRRST